MVVKCPKCKKKYKVDPDKVTEKGAKITCPNCTNVFIVRKKAEGETKEDYTPCSVCGQPATQGLDTDHPLCDECAAKEAEKSARFMPMADEEEGPGPGQREIDLSGASDFSFDELSGKDHAPQAYSTDVLPHERSSETDVEESGGIEAEIPSAKEPKDFFEGTDTGRPESPPSLPKSPPAPSRQVKFEAPSMPEPPRSDGPEPVRPTLSPAPEKPRQSSPPPEQEASAPALPPEPQQQVTTMGPEREIAAKESAAEKDEAPEKTPSEPVFASPEPGRPPEEEPAPPPSPEAMASSPPPVKRPDREVQAGKPPPPPSEEEPVGTSPVPLVLAIILLLVLLAYVLNIFGVWSF